MRGKRFVLEDYERAGIGRRSDSAVARALGLRRVSVLLRRQRHGIELSAAARREGRDATRYAAVRHGSEMRARAKARLLAAGAGVVPDHVVAARLGYTRAAVCAARARYGIAAVSRGGRPRQIAPPSGGAP